MRIVERTRSKAFFSAPLRSLLKPPAETEARDVRSLGITGGTQTQCLAEKHGIRHYPTPRRILLTDPELAGRIRKLFTQSPSFGGRDPSSPGGSISDLGTAPGVAGGGEPEAPELFGKEKLLRVHGSGRWPFRAGGEKDLSWRFNRGGTASKRSKPVEVDCGKDIETPASRFFVSLPRTTRSPHFVLSHHAPDWAVKGQRCPIPVDALPFWPAGVQSLFLLPEFSRPPDTFGFSPVFLRKSLFTAGTGISPGFKPVGGRRNRMFQA